jgi:uncharacterized protein YjbJ (UPF0337 family)
MGFIDKLRNRFMMARGRGKQEAGRTAGDPYLEAEGRSERVEGGVRQAGERAKDSAKDIKDAFKK